MILSRAPPVRLHDSFDEHQNIVFLMTDTQSELIAFIQENESKALEDPAIAKQVKAAKRKLKISIDEEQ